jgi:hypothetical protein
MDGTFSSWPHWDATKAIAELQAASPYELGQASGGGTVGIGLYPVYVRADASRAAKRWKAGCCGISKSPRPSGVVLYEPIGALAHLGLAHAYALQGETAKARVAYQNFLSSRKDADPDIPILIAAKSEYAKLK